MDGNNNADTRTANEAERKAKKRLLSPLIMPGCLSYWVPYSGLFLMGMVLTLITVISVKEEAIWRGPGLEPMIMHSNNPIDYYVFVIFLVFMSLTSWIGLFYLIVTTLRK